MRWLLVFLIVITNPYKYLDYNQINLYDLSEKVDYSIEVIEPEPEDYREETPEVFICYLCNPPAEFVIEF